MPDKMNQQINGIAQGIIGAIKPAAHFKPPAYWLLCDDSEQARLAASGQWDELKQMQDTLIGGRRT